MRADSQRHRALLIEAAVRVFARDGGDAPLEAVVRESGLGRGTLYRHFPNREALALAALDAELTRLEAFIAGGGSPGFLRDFLRRQALASALYTPLFRGLNLASIQHQIPAINERVDRVIRQGMRLAQAAGQIRATVTLDQMRLASSMVACSVPPSDADHDNLEAALDLMIQGLGAPSRP